MKFLIFTTVACVVVGEGVGVAAWGSGDKIKLKDVEVLTLRHGQFTNGRRSPGVPQLSCVGGTAGCSAFVPQVVQCYNKGWDGSDVQWQCRTDMDNAFRFGKVEVTCEGYDYPDDPYILKGSCGLEYTIDLTKEGMGQHSYYGGGDGMGGGGSYGWNVPPYKKTGSNTSTNIACGIILVLIVYAFYKTCIAPNVNTQRSRTNDDYPDGRGGGSGARPPPPGFNPSYYPSAGGSDSCGAGDASSGPAAGGFWTGAATGGLLGYMFGARNNADNSYYGYNRPRPSTSYGFSSGSNTNWGGSSGGSASTSSGTRSAEGYGGTRRR